MALTALASGLLSLGVAAAPAAASSAPPAGGWRWPLAGNPVVARPFQPPAHPWSAGHRGVDLAGPPDALVLAAGAGVVGFAGYVAGVGVVTVVHPGGLRTTYEPVTPQVRVGRAVAAGDPLGRLLPGHGDCGPGRWCLHWGLLRGAVYLDPLTLVRRGPVRLLPVATDSLGAAVRLSPAAAPAMVEPRGQAAPADARPESPLTTRRPAEDGRGLASPLTAAAATATAALAGWLARRRAGGAARWISRAGRRAWT